MRNIPESIMRKIADPTPDINDFVNVMTGKSQPNRIYLGELFADQQIMEWIYKEILGKEWVPYPDDPADLSQTESHFLCEIEYWYRMGYDYIRVSGGADFPMKFHAADDTAGDMSHIERRWIDSKKGLIQNWEDFERYPWPKVTDENLWMYDFVANHLPEGMEVMVCPNSGFLEIPSEYLIGFEALSMMIFEEPEFLKAVFDKVKDIILECYRRIVGIEKVAGFFQGDDMGYRSSTLLSPDTLKEYSLPGHKEAVEIAHSHDKIYMLHSCGNLYGKFMDYLIDEIGIDVKQSYEDVIMPVEEAYRIYGERVGIMGGVDIDMLGRADEDVLRERIRTILDKCASKGRYAFGSGNTIANYSKKENVLAMFDEAYCWKI